MVDFCFLCDIMVNFNLGYVDKRAMSIVVDRRDIAKRYVLSGWFFIDLISVMPFDVVAMLSKSESVAQLKTLRMIRLFRLIKLIKVSKIGAIYDRFESKLHVKYSTIKLAKFTVWIFVFAHWLACLFHM